jgi:hypothetical protein
VFNDVVEASFPASDPLPYVHDPAASSHDSASYAIQGTGRISLVYSDNNRPKWHEES